MKNMLTSTGFIIYGSAMIAVDFVILVLNIMLVAIFRCHKPVVKFATSAAAKAEAEKQVCAISLNVNYAIVQTKMNEAVARAVIMHLLCGTIPVIVLAICLFNSDVMTNYTFALIIELLALLTIFKTVITVVFFATRIHGLKETFGFKNTQVAVQATEEKF